MEANRFRLSVMMFGQYLVMGTWAVTLATYLMSPPTRGGLNFPPLETGWIYSTLALSAIISPIFTGLLADRLFVAEKLLGVMHLLGALLLAGAGCWCAVQQPKIEAAYRALADYERFNDESLLELDRRIAESRGNVPPQTRLHVRDALQRVNDSEQIRGLVQETFTPLFFLMLGYCFCNVTGITLTNVIAFRNLQHPSRSFGTVRLWGTVGWIVAGVHLEMLWNPIAPTQLFLAAAFSVVFGVFSFGLPSTPPSGKSRSLAESLGLTALSMLRDHSVRVLILCTLGISAVQQFYGVYSNRFLTELHAPYPAAIQTIAQVFEVTCMVLCPFALRRFGLKTTLGLGLSAWIIRNSIFATESLPAVIFVGLPLHGVSYAFFVMVASMYMDRMAPTQVRASAQGIFTFVSMGAGTLFGNWLSARVVQRQTLGDVVDWSGVWIVPAISSAAIFLVFVLLFRETPKSHSAA